MIFYLLGSKWILERDVSAPRYSFLSTLCCLLSQTAVQSFDLSHKRCFHSKTNVASCLYLALLSSISNLCPRIKIRGKPKSIYSGSLNIALRSNLSLPSRLRSLLQFFNKRNESIGWLVILVLPKPSWMSMKTLVIEITQLNYDSLTTTYPSPPSMAQNL